MLGEVWAVGRSGFDDDVQRCQTGGVDAEEMRVGARIQAMHAETGQSDGSRRMAKPLQEEGVWVGRWKARRVMPPAGVSVRGRSRRRPQTTDSRHGVRVAANLLERPCDVDRPNTAWCGDITSLWTEAGWVYVSVLVDWYARNVVGWAMRHHLAVTLVADALHRALGRRSPAAGLMHHSDRGSQYACHVYRGLLADNGVQCRMSRQGDCLDHAVAERFLGSLKRERTTPRA